MLTQVLLKLKAAGLVKSTRGSAGGYRLARPAGEIPLGEVLHTMDGHNGVPRDLPRASAKELALVWAKIRETEPPDPGGDVDCRSGRVGESPDWVI